jgi:hypothetical protein
MNERNGIAWFGLEIWKLRGFRKGEDGGICPIFTKKGE